MERQLQRAHAAIGLNGMHVLEVGGCVYPEHLAAYSPKKWDAIDISPNRLALVSGRNIPESYDYYQMSVTDMTFPDNSFDRIFSINCFEHIQGIEKAYSEMYRVLKPGVMLFTIFGPIWSAPIGHHTWVHDGNDVIHFNNHVFPHWHHLAFEKWELYCELLKKYSPEVAGKIVKYIYDSADLNRLTDGDHLKAVDCSDFNVELMFLRKRNYRLTKWLERKIHERWPGIIDPRNTEILLILNKGRLSTANKINIRLRLAKQLIKEKIK